MKTEKRANRYHSDMENDRVQTYRRIASTMFDDGVINMGRVLVLFAFTSQMGQQYPTDSWKFWDIYHAVLKGTIRILQSIAHPPIRIEEKEPIRKLHFINNRPIETQNDCPIRYDVTKEIDQSDTSLPMNITSFSKNSITFLDIRWCNWWNPQHTKSKR